MGVANFVSRFRLVALALAVSGSAAMAQDAPAAAGSGPSLRVELNALQPSDRGCRFTFIATNQLGSELKSVGLELVLFNKAGMVSRITIVDFKDLPEGKTKVRQFDFSGVQCADLGRVLVNDTTDCAGDGIEPKACIRYLETETRAETEFGV
jgi:hypothetical protein